jgi:hypothetical protein
MTDDDLADLLATVREAERQALGQRKSRKVQQMSKADRAAYLKSRGWWQMSTSGSQRWQDKSGTSATLSGACAIQLARDAGAR